MEWIDFAGWDSDVFRQPYAVRGWVPPAPKPKQTGRAEMDAQVLAFVKACPEAHLERCAPVQELR